MKMTARQYAILLYELVSDAKKADVPQRVQSFLKYLVRGRRTMLVGNIIAAFETLCDEHDKVWRVDVTSARKITKTIKEELRKVLGAEKIDVRESLDPTLIGGMRLRVGDTIIDGTLKTRLENLHNTFTSSAS